MPLIRQALRGGRVERSRGLPAVNASGTAAGLSVTPERALQVGAVYSCVRLLAESGSGLPVGLFRRAGTGRQRVEDHPLVPLVTDQANPTLDSAEFWRLIFAWMLLRGNAYAYVERGTWGDPLGLWPIAPTSVEPGRGGGGQLLYRVELASDEYAPIREKNGVVSGEDLLHYRALGLGVEGLSPIGLARQSVATSFAASSYIGRFFQNDASPGGIVSVPGALTDTQYERLTEQWRDRHEGFSRAHRLAVLEAGAKWERVGLAPADAAFLDIHRLGRKDIAAMYNIPAFMVGDDTATTWGSGIEQMSLGYVIYALMPWLVRAERVTRRLHGGDRNLYLRFDPDGLLRGDLGARYEAYAKGRQWGWLSVNDIRAKEDEDPIEDGDLYLQPVNMVPAGTLPAPTPEPAPPVDPEEDPLVDPASTGGRRAYRARPPAELAPAWVDRHRDALRSFLGRQRDAALAAQTRATEDAVEAVSGPSWTEELAAILFELAFQLAGEIGQRTADGLGGSFVVEWLRAYLETDADSVAKRVNATTTEQLAHALADAEDPKEALVEFFALMLEERAASLARARVNTVGNFSQHEAARQSGAIAKTWRTTGTETRPSHAAVDGQTVGMDETFEVGGRRGRWPRDGRLGVDEVAGCDCTLDYTA